MSNLKKLLEDRRMTQRDLAKKIKMTHTWVNSICQDDKAILYSRLNTVIKIANALNVPISYLAKEELSNEYNFYKDLDQIEPFIKQELNILSSHEWDCLKKVMKDFKNDKLVNPKDNLISSIIENKHLIEKYISTKELITKVNSMNAFNCLWLIRAIKNLKHSGKI